MLSVDDSGSELSTGLNTALTSTTPRNLPHSYSRSDHPVRRRKRFSSTALSTDTLSSLPEYRSPNHTPPRPSRPLLPSQKNSLEPGPPASWDAPQQSPPPTYPGLGQDDDDGRGEERNIVPLLIPVLKPGPRKLRRRRSVGGTSDRLDSLLERSVLALEASNELLQSSVTTHSSLSAVLADQSFDRSVDVQIRYLAKRMGVEDHKEHGLDRVLEEVVGLLEETSISARKVVSAADDGGVSRSLPAENRMAHLCTSSSSNATAIPGAGSQFPQQSRRLRLSEGPRPRSPPPRPFTQYVSIESPNGLALEATSTPETILLPPTSGIRTAPHEATLRPSPAPSPLITTSQLPPTQISVLPLTAHTMLSRIHSRSSSASRSASPEASRILLSGGGSVTSPPKRMFKDDQRPLRGNGTGSMRSAFAAHGRRESDPLTSPLFGTTKSCPERMRSHSIDAEPHQQPEASTSSAPGASESVIDLWSTPLGEQEVGVGLTASYKVSLNLRKILAEAEKQVPPPISEAAHGKQREEGERPSMIISQQSNRSSSAHRPPALVSAASSPSSPSQPIVSWEVSTSAGLLPSQHLQVHVPPTPLSAVTTITTDVSSAAPSPTPSVKRRSALKGSSGRSTPLSSGQSSPRVVTFSPLPPKHDSDGSVRRAREKSKAAARAKAQEEPKETKGWWTEWLLGSTPMDVGGSRPFAPVYHTRTGSMLREEGRWNAGGMESWQM